MTYAQRLKANQDRRIGRGPTGILGRMRFLISMSKTTARRHGAITTAVTGVAHFTWAELPL